MLHNLLIVPVFLTDFVVYPVCNIPLKCPHKEKKKVTSTKLFESLNKQEPSWCRLSVYKVIIMDLNGVFWVVAAKW